MKTHCFINIISGMATKIFSGISDMTAMAVSVLKAIVDVPVMEPRRVKVPVRVQRSEFSDRSEY